MPVSDDDRARRRSPTQRARPLRRCAGCSRRLTRHRRSAGGTAARRSGCGVIKVEEPREGDPARRAALVRGRSPLAGILLAASRVWRSTSSSRRRSKHCAAFSRAPTCCSRASVPHHGAAGMAPQVLRERYPRLSSARSSVGGRRGVCGARRPHITFRRSAARWRRPAPAGIQVADIVGEWSAVTSVLAALLARSAGARAVRTAKAAAAHGSNRRCSTPPCTPTSPAGRLRRPA